MVYMIFKLDGKVVGTYNIASKGIETDDKRLRGWVIDGVDGFTPSPARDDKSVADITKIFTPQDEEFVPVLYDIASAKGYQVSFQS